MIAQISLDNIVRSYFISRGQSTLHGYIRALKAAIDCLRKIHLNYAILTKVVKNRVDQKFAIPYPDDLLVPVALWWVDGDRIVSVQPDNSVALKHSYAADAISATANSLFENIINEGITLECGLAYEDGTVNGVGYNNVGYMNFNHRAREVQFSSEIDSSRDYYLAYRSSGFNPKSQSMVSEVFTNMVECYISWKEAERRHGKASAEAEANRVAYEREQDEVIRQLMPVTEASILAAKARSIQFNRTAF